MKKLMPPLNKLRPQSKIIHSLLYYTIPRLTLELHYHTAYHVSRLPIKKRAFMQLKTIVMIAFITSSICKVKSCQENLDKAEPYDNLNFMDTLAQETAETWDLKEYYVARNDKNRKPLDILKQLKIAKYYLYKKGNIEKIKFFYEKNSLSYDDPYYVELWKGWEKNYNANYARFPLEWSLSKCKFDFAFWLIQEKKVTIAKSKQALHYLAQDIAHRQLNQEHIALIKLLIENNASIHVLYSEIGSPDCPLSWYIRCISSNTKRSFHSSQSTSNRSDKTYDHTVFLLFFNHGCRIMYKESETLKCNVIFTILKSPQPFLGITYLYKAWLESTCPTGSEYINRLVHQKTQYAAYFKLFALWNRRESDRKVPKPLIHYICRLATWEEEKISEIKSALNDSQIERVIISDSSTRPVRIHSKEIELTPLQYVQRKKKSAHFYYENFEKIVSLSFWDQPFLVCKHLVEAFIKNPLSL